jgi:hypothetical protein
MTDDTNPDIAAQRRQLAESAHELAENAREYLEDREQRGQDYQADVEADCRRSAFGVIAGDG